MPAESDSSVGTRAWATDRLRLALGDRFSVVVGALEFAADCHAGQVRLARSGTLSVPYLEHPVGVALLCSELWETTGLAEPPRETLIRAALLHDVLEDCAVSIDELELRFGTEVTALVLALTKPELRERESADARMRRFSAQIGKAGPQAAFLKACDLIHNLSGLETTPPDVIRRALDRGQRYYLPLIDSAGLGEPMRLRLANALAGAEAALATAEQAAPGKDGRLDRAILSAIHGRVDVHDVERLLQEICGVGEALVVRFSRRGQPTVVSGSLEVDLDAGRLAHIRKLTQEAGGVARLSPRLLRTSKSDPASPQDAVYTAVDATFDGGGTMVVWSLQAGYGSALPPAFSARAVLLLVLAVVSKPAARMHRDIAIEALSLGIELDLWLVDELRIHRGHLRKLARWRRLCDLASEQVEAEVRSFIHSQERRGSLWHRVRVERRTKTFPSILRKFASHHALDWPDFSTMEDIGGVRVICPIASHVEACVRFFERSTAERPLRCIPRRYDFKPTADGYRGVHVIRDVRLPGEPDAVPCEVQIRTLLQDAWSTLSHAVAYKADSEDARQRRGDLRRLSEQIHECDEAATEIFGREAGTDDS